MITSYDRDRFVPHHGFECNICLNTHWYFGWNCRARQALLLLGWSRPSRAILLRIGDASETEACSPSVLSSIIRWIVLWFFGIFILTFTFKCSSCMNFVRDFVLLVCAFPDGKGLSLHIWGHVPSLLTLMFLDSDEFCFSSSLKNKTPIQCRNMCHPRSPILARELIAWPMQPNNS